jgi:DNA recombination protein RmuC
MKDHSMDTNIAVLIISSTLFMGIGLTMGYLLARSAFNSQLKTTQMLLDKEDKKKDAERAKIIETLKNNFNVLSREALKHSNESFLQLAEQRLKQQSESHSSALDARKGLIDQQLNSMTHKLSAVTSLVFEFEEKRAEKLGALGEQLQHLTQTSETLHRALVNNQARGQWGERIAEDVLHMLGFVENVNYTKQTVIEVDSGGKKSRPDFTFHMPNGIDLNMDVKFPLTSYIKYLESDGQTDKDAHCKKFLKDVRDRIKEIGGKGYIDALRTVDCALIFIPNEQIYRFIHEQDYEIIEEALNQKVILCSPLTLFIVLSVVRQAVSNFKLEKSSQDILKLLNDFKKQWNMYTKEMDSLGTNLSRAYEGYQELLGKRKNGMERQLSQIDKLTKSSGLEEELLQLEA